MNVFLFAIHNVLLATRSGNVDMPDCDYSVMYSLNIEHGKPRVTVDFRSVRRLEWRDNTAHWVAAHVDAPILVEVERQIQQDVEREAFEDSMSLLEEVS